MFALFVPVSSYIVSAVRLAQFVILLGHLNIAPIVYWFVGTNLSLRSIDEAARLTYI